jgi:FhuF 2Fe-2S C-terminal domain
VPAASLRDALAALGPFFAVGRPEDPGPWRPVPVSPELLRERTAAVQTALALGSVAPVELRTAASVAQLGLAARLVSPAFGAALLDGRLVSMDEALWQPVLGGRVPLALTDATLRGVPYDGLLVDALGRHLLDGPVRDLVEATAAMSVSRQVLWGNVASAVNGAATIVATARPELATAARVLAAGLLEQPALRGTTTGAVGVDFRRLSCCLIYRIGATDPKSVCGDCVIHAQNNPKM